MKSYYKTRHQTIWEVHLTKDTTKEELWESFHEFLDKCWQAGHSKPDIKGGETLTVYFPINSPGSF